MRSTNFVYFLTVQGFFISVAFGIVEATSAENLLGLVILITSFFYLFAHIVVAFYFQTLTSKTYYFPKTAHEHNLDYFVRELNKREQFVDAFHAHKEELLEGHGERREA
ncbi:MAG: hypothetical protein AB7S65_05345 [Sulfuricurvum sp.]